ncbi:diguanylate cyclase [Kiritimatiellota bacterium B12222]|nr:diguanylate cyclase [Kiritimatiellota bacterium B12222]
MTSQNSSTLFAETTLIQQMTDMGFREMDQNRMLEVCLLGLCNHYQGQGAALLIKEHGQTCIQLIHQHIKLHIELQNELQLQLRAHFKEHGHCEVPEILCKIKNEKPTKPQVALQLNEWTIIPLETENQFLGILMLDMDDPIDEPFHLNVVLHHLCSLLLTMQNMRKLLITDPMTSCYNRWFMEVELSRFCALTPSPHRRFAVMLIDLDHFKSINDTYGHTKGDTCLINLIELLKKFLNKTDAIIRMGGDEFLIWFPKVGNRNLTTLAEKILTAVRETLHVPEVPDHQLSISIGLVVHEPGTPQPSKQRLLDCADHALYASKHKGRNQMTAWTPELEYAFKQWSESERKIPKPEQRIQALEAQIQHERDSWIDTLTLILQNREYSTGLHSERVTRITAYLLEQLVLTPEQKIQIIRGARLHDIGKIAIPDHILNKQGKLNESEWTIIKKHPQIGQHFISGHHFLKDAGNIILCHHENYDGSGYPNGLKGKEIPLGARLFSLVDAYDSMRANRVYKNFMAPEDVTAELRKNAGTQFDPELIDFFMDHIDTIEDIGKWQM